MCSHEDTPADAEVDDTIDVAQADAGGHGRLRGLQHFIRGHGTCNQ